jgi:histidyl-tRNA synthetase
MDYGPKGLKAQMKRADKLNAKNVLIVGEDELFSGKAVLRNMDTKVQEEIDLNNIYDILNRLVGRQQSY